MTNALKRSLAKRWVNKKAKFLESDTLAALKIDGLKDPEEVHQIRRKSENWFYTILFSELGRQLFDLPRIG